MGRTDRQNAILTTSQRDFLLGIADVDRTGSHKRNFETDLRKRIRSGLMDFQTLNSGIDKRDLRLVFDKQFVESDGINGNLKCGNLPEPSELEFGDTAMAYIAVTHLVAFGYGGLRAIGNDPDSVMNNAIMRGVLMGEANHRGVDRSLIKLDWSFDLAVHEQAQADPLEKWKENIPLSTEDRAELHEKLIKAVPEEIYQEATPMDFDDLVEEYLVSEE
jgi:hypothetical protein